LRWVEEGEEDFGAGDGWVCKSKLEDRNEARSKLSGGVRLT